MPKIWGGVFILFGIAVVGVGGWYFFYSQGVPGYWALDEEASEFYVSSTKNGDIEERHTIHKLDGRADFTGAFVIRIDLTTIDTGVEIRDERMREFLFETAKFPVARIEGNFDPEEVAKIPVGETLTKHFPFTLSLHGVEKDMTAAITIARPAWNRVVLTPAGDIVIHAGDFNFKPGLETLRGLVGLESISPEVPVDFTLVFDGDSENIRIN